MQLNKFMTESKPTSNDINSTSYAIIILVQFIFKND